MAMLCSTSGDQPEPAPTSSSLLELTPSHSTWSLEADQTVFRWKHSFVSTFHNFVCSDDIY